MGWDKVKRQDMYSHTQMSMYQRCPRQYYFRYVLGKKSPPSVKMILGIGVHAGTEVNMLSKFKKKKPAKREEVMDTFDKYWKGAKSGVAMEGTKPGVWKDHGYGMAGIHYDEIAPKIKPVEKPEWHFQIELPGVSKPIQGYVDVIHGKEWGKGEIVRDTKTSTRKKPEAEVHMTSQLTLYAIARQAHTKKIPGVGLDTLTYNSKGYNAQPLTSKRTSAELKEYVGNAVMIDKAIQAGIFPTCDSIQTCGWCGFQDICKGTVYGRMGT